LLFLTLVKEQPTMSTQGKFCKEEVKHVREGYEEVLNAIPKSKKLDYVGHMNDMFLFLSAAEQAAPAAKDVK
jgi:hypothetical protein